MALVVGPIEPATKRSEPNSAATSRASFAAASLISSARSWRPYSPSTSGVLPKVSVPTMSDPAS